MKGGRGVLSVSQSIPAHPAFSMSPWDVQWDQPQWLTVSGVKTMIMQ